MEEYQAFVKKVNGNARGGVPSARIVVYKVCWESGCDSEDILAAFDDAISDGVDILSLSLGSDSAHKYYEDAISIGAYHAMQRVILTSNSAGNSGPEQGTTGRAMNSFDILNKVTLVHGNLKDQGNNGSLEGKIVVYNGYTDGEPALTRKASGMIVHLENEVDNANQFYQLHLKIVEHFEYEETFYTVSDALVDRNPVASILKSETFEDVSAPRVVSFSSRGPNPITQPDITAPGVEIFAAWSPDASPSGVIGDPRSVKYNIISGTSMSCPHVTGAAVYVKTFHPDWSPSAIKFALMTRAFPLNPTTNPDAEFGYGVGHIDPVKVVRPGLVYDALEGDYLKFLCRIGYTTEQTKLVSGAENDCPKNFKGSVKDLNYPSIVSFVANATFSRTITNVGVANSTYKAMSLKAFEIYSASLVWFDGVHIVRSPIVVMHNTSARYVNTLGAI
ncbi:hypothetical protein IFM89_016198 [Coptis chinensis]|uniref:Peptidase S8/S53 domain-containing protein n=1 Tax=Coptis chinensis TaxID=261450 RepID=A0A835ITQ7_9MAGN|nr:hypothetical protein IFM89_016198 [Coptis chinensis]